jgi:DNA-3-methyladenine glycosylase
MKPELYDATLAAPALLGWLLVHDSTEGRTSGYITETEAYMSSDAASHSYRGKTPRTEIMFGPPGYLYVYFTYGMHYCVNIVTGPEGNGQGVLIRALEPVDGIDIMAKRRGIMNEIGLTNGPAKLAQAMGFGRQHNGQYALGDGSIKLLPGNKPHKIVQAKRIGITREVDKLWRFYIEGSPYISRI